MSNTTTLARLNSEVLACAKAEEPKLINPKLLAAYIAFLVELQYYD